MVKPHTLSRGPGIVAEALHTLVSQIPISAEAPGPNPDERAKSLAKTAALKAAAISGSFTLPPGPFGMATVLPDLLAVWRIQQQLVADIAATFGRGHALTAETMIICLFKHGGAALTKPLFAREDKEVVVQRIAGRTLLQLLEKIGVRIAQRIAAKSVLRWLPILGAVGAGAYAYFDTAHVAKNAMELFSANLRIAEAEPAEPAEEVSATTKPVRRRSPRKARPKAVEKKASASDTPETPRPRSRSRSRRRPSTE